MKALGLISAILLLAGVASAQGMVEYGAIAGAATSASGGVSKIGSSLEKAFKGVEGSLSGKSTARDTTLERSAGRSTAVRKPAPPPPPKPSKEVFTAVAPGLERAELIAKAGRPAFAIVSSDEEILSYLCKEGASYTVVLKDGKVSEVKEK